MLLNFQVARPKSHFGTGCNKAVLKLGAPAMPIMKPDLTKLVRSTEDALAGILWRDNCQVVGQEAQKRYCAWGEAGGCWILVEPMETLLCQN